MSPEEGEGTDLDGLTMYCGFLGCCRQFFKVQGWKVTISFHQYQFYTPWNLRWPGAKPRHRTVRMLCPSTHGAGQGGLKGELWNWLWSSSCRHPFCSFFSRILKRIFTCLRSIPGGESSHLHLGLKFDFMWFWDGRNAWLI